MLFVRLSTTAVVYAEQKTTQQSIAKSATEARQDGQIQGATE